MDTRKKIIDARAAHSIAASGATVVSGYFDPMVASHAERLAGMKTANGKLLVLIAPPANEILPSAARAELVASLACVDYVAELAPGLVAQVNLELEDHDRYKALLHHVHARQRASS